jgi:hypothetical protein
MSVLVLRGCSVGGRIHGVGIGDGWRPSFALGAVGERFEAPGPELVAIETNGSGANEPDDQHAHGIHAFAWGVTNGEPAAVNDFNRWRGEGTWLVLEVAACDLVHDKRRSSGRCRVKRGSVKYRGALPGAVGVLRESWPKDTPPPAWELDPVLFPPETPNEPILWVRGPMGWLVPA